MSGAAKQNKNMKNNVKNLFFNAQPAEKCADKIKRAADNNSSESIGIYFAHYRNNTQKHRGAGDDVDRNRYLSELFKKEKL